MKKSRNKVRIISGSHRGRLVDFPDQPGLRPTGDRLRETLFSWLQSSLPGSRCLDMFAGSGALGFEAASRGAQVVYLIEKSRKVTDQLRRGIGLLGFENVQLQCADSTLENTLSGYRPDRSHESGSGIDIVFIDPPFADFIHQRAIDQLAEANILADNALVSVEVGRRTAALTIPDDWQQEKEKVAGDVCLRLYRTGKSAQNI